MESNVNSILMYIGATVSMIGIVSGLVIGHYYSGKASGYKKLARTEFNRGIILMAVTGFLSVAGIGCAMLIKVFLEPEPVSVLGVIVTSFLCLGLPPLFTAGTFILSFKRSVEKEE